MDRKIKINDRVRLINPFDETKSYYPLLTVGDEGKVVDIFDMIKPDHNWKDFRKKYYIDWGKPINDHDCAGRCKNGHGSSVEREEIEVL